MKKIPVVVDLPVRTPKLGFEKYVEALAAAVLGGTPARYTIGLYGPWGTGKSSILQALELKLLTSDTPPLVVKFDAWRHERVDNVMLPFLWKIQEAVKEAASAEPTSTLKRFSKENSKKAASAISKLMRGMEFAAVGGLFSVKMSETLGLPQQVEDNNGNRTDTYMEGLNQLQILGESIEGRIVVLIDDLDRCSPDRVVELIEAVRLLMDVEGFVFVLAIDYEVLLDAIRHKYQHADSEKFIEKIVQVPFWIPSLQIEDENLLSSLIPQWGELRDEWFAGVEAKKLQRIFKLALRGNPRQIKRLMNSYLVARYVIGDQSEQNNLMLAASIAMQLRWPKSFRTFEEGLNSESELGQSPLTVDNTKAYANLTSFLEEGDEFSERDLEAQDRRELGMYVQEFFCVSLQVGDLLGVMRIAANVSGNVPSVELPARIEQSIRVGKAFEAEVLHELTRLAANSGIDFDSQSRVLNDAAGRLVLQVQNVNHKTSEAVLKFGAEYTCPAEYLYKDNSAFVSSDQLQEFITDLKKML
ncbi:KAP family P-loop NTPase fold protein [Glutamicibacter mysorens]|uniref:KAP family P-loop NTPase fold protein n=1 Tax=Glutamicibacter mysorens TaxID=257984 RepID=UPI0020C7356F|nr:P-loop NTPase fold protein [Glutamicibacter mysorens]UTM45920.1 KAP family NTPase [Glutamicibacter mysorens]